MWCLACGVPAADKLCGPCAHSLRPTPERLVDPGVLARSAFAHSGAAKQLVHNLKYRPIAGSEGLLAASIAPLVAGGSMLVPVPRAGARKWMSGVDPALRLATALSGIVGLPVSRALTAPLWWSRHAGAGRTGRGPVAFRARRGDTAGAVLVDDVITTGRTMESAIAALSVLPALVVTATSAGKMSIG